MKDDSNEIKGKAKGGIARAHKLTQEERSNIARKAALVRHSANKPLFAIRKGNFKDDFNLDIDCYVLGNDSKTAVISQSGMGAALGLAGGGGTAFIRFVSGVTISKYISPELSEKIKNPIKFQLGGVNSASPSTNVYGYDVTILIDVCQAVLLAETAGELKSNQKHVANQAKVLLAASAKSGIQELVYKLSGFDSSKEQFIQAFKQFVNDEAKKYEKEFPLELYEEWARIYEIKLPERGWPWEFKHLTVKHIYHPLAKSNGKLLSLLRESKGKDGDKGKKLFQFLNEIGTRALRMHLGRVLEMAESSKSKVEYEAKIEKRFGDQHRLPLDED